MRLTQQSIAFYFVLMGLYAVAWWLQNSMVLNGDVSMLMHETQKLLLGGTYTRDFFEPKPPMIFYLYILPVLFSQWLSLSFVVVLPLFVFLLSWVSLFLCYSLIKKIFVNETADLRGLFILMLAVVFVVLPFNELGQGENLLIILTMPYFLACVCRLQNSRVQFGYLVVIGLMGGLGFSIKPQYLSAFCLVELFYVYEKRNLFAWVRTEAVMIVGVLFGYCLSILIFHRDYIFFIVPHVSQFFYLSMGTPWREVLLSQGVIYCGITAIFFLVTYQSNPQKKMSAVLIVALSGFLIACIVQKTPWYYHVYPAMAMAILGNFLFIILLARQDKASGKNYFWLVAMAFVTIAFLYYFDRAIWVTLVFSPITFFSYFFVLFGVLFFVAKIEKPIFSLMILTFFVMLICYGFTYLASFTPWFMHRFSLTLLLLFMFFCLFVSEDRVKKSRALFVAFLGMLIFSFPWYSGFSKIAEISQYPFCYQGLMAFLESQARGRSVYFFSSMIDEYPALDYVENVTYASRYPCLFWLPGLLKQPITARVREETKYYIDSVADELNKNKPDFVFVDMKKNKMRLQHISLDYVSYFSRNNAFQHAWKAYHYLTMLDGYPTYQFAVYQRRRDFT